MQLLPLLGKQLKEDDVIELLEGMEMDVIYDFDRLHEGEPDKYWAASTGAGIQLGFDAAQVLDVIFLFTVQRDGFEAFSPKGCDISLFSSATQVQTFGETEGLRIAKGTADFLGVSRDWVRLGFAAHSAHYEFHDDVLALVTISRNEPGTV